MKYEETPPEWSSCTRSEHHNIDTEREENIWTSVWTDIHLRFHSKPESSSFSTAINMMFSDVLSHEMCFIVSIVVHVFIWLFSVSNTVKSLVMRWFHPAENLIYFTFIMSDAIDVLIESLCSYYQEEMIWPMSWIGLIRNHLRLAEESGWMCEYEFFHWQWVCEFLQAEEVHWDKKEDSLMDWDLPKYTMFSMITHRRHVFRHTARSTHLHLHHEYRACFQRCDLESL